MPELAINEAIDQTEEQYRQIRDTVYKHCGINLHDGKKELVRSRLAKRLRKYNKTSYAEYLDNVLSNPNGSAFCEFINSLTSNLTWLSGAVSF